MTTTSRKKLAAIMFTDIAGYTALMGSNESKAMELLKNNRALQKPLIEKQILKKQPPKKDDWSLLWKGLGLIIFLLIVAFFVNVYFLEERIRGKFNCKQMEADAQNTLAAISSFFSDPARRI